MEKQKVEEIFSTLPKFEDIIGTPLHVPIAEDILKNSRQILIKENGECMVEILQEHGFKEFDRSKFLAPETRTKSLWARGTVLRKLLLGNALIKKLTQGNPPKYGDMLQLRIREVYRPIEAQRACFKDQLEREIEKAANNAAKGTRAAKILCADPAGFDENDPTTWRNHTPPHTTGAAVDVFLWSDFGSDKSAITIPNYRDINDHYATDYFEKKLITEQKLDSQEEICLRNRRLLFTVMEAVGFRNYIKEAWHYSYGDQMWAMVERLHGKESTIAYYSFASSPEAERATVQANACLNS